MSRPDESILDELRLQRADGVGPKSRQELIEYFGTASDVLRASESELTRVSGVGPKTAFGIRQASELTYEEDFAKEFQACEESGVALHFAGNEGYPSLLNELPSPPGSLYIRGEYLPRDQISLAVVGTRHPTTYGRRAAEMLAGGLARAGMTIVSGLAYGIDEAAHRAALNAGGRTIAVLGSGILNIYPETNRGIAEEIVARNAGAIFSEYPPFAAPHPGAFPQRNRIVSGLTLGTIVVEAAQRSGALITARLAMEQNREVFAVPGPITNRSSQGCHALLRDGAHLAGSVEDILEALGPLAEGVEMAAAAEGETTQKVRHPAELALNDIEKGVLALVTKTPVLPDTIVQNCELMSHQVIAALMALEAKRLVRKCENGGFQRV